MKLYWQGMYYNLFLPGGIGGDGYKIYLLNKKTKAKVKFLLRAILLDRVTGLLVLGCLNLLLVYYLPVHFYLKVIMWISIPVVIFIFYFIIKRYFYHFIKSFKKTNLLSLFVQILQIICVYFIMVSIGIKSDIGAYLFVFLLSSVVAVIPFTIGGIGSREITFYLGAEIIGLSAETSVIISIIFFLITAFVSLFGVYFSFSMKKNYFKGI